MYVEQLNSGRYRAEVRQYGTRKKVRRTFDYRHEAEAWARATEAAMVAIAEAAAPPAPPTSGPVRALGTEPCGVTLTEAATAWLAGKEGLTQSTRNGYARAVAVIVADGIGAMDMAQVTKPMVLAWQTRMDREGTGRVTNNATLRVLRMVYLDAIAQGIVRLNPTYKVRDLTPPIRADRILTTDEDVRLMAAAATPEAIAFILCALDGGLRWGEVAGLTAGAVSGDYITVRQVVETTTRSIRPFPKGKRPRVVPMTSRLRAALAPLVEAAADLDSLLFTSEDGHLLDYNNWRKYVWLPALRGAKMAKPRPRFHDLRHTCGTRLAAAGMPRYQIAEVLGHADESTTARYIHAGEDGHRLDMVRKALGG